MARKADPNKRKLIIQAAASVFAHKGFTGTLMAQVAVAAGIGKGTIYEYFQSKEDLFFGVFEHIMTEASTQVMATAHEENGSVAQRLQSLSNTLIQAWLDQLDLYSLVMEFWSATTNLSCRQRFKTAFQTGYSDFRRMIGALIQKGIDDGEFSTDGDPEKIASALIGTWDALLLQAWLDPDFDALGAAQAHMDIMLKGMARE